MSFLNVMLLFFLFRSGLARHGLKWKILLKSKSTQNFRDIKACGSVKIRRRENVRLIVTNRIDRFKLQLLPYEYQKQSPEGILPKRYSKKFRKIHRKTPLAESLFNKFAGVKLAILLKERLWRRCVPMNFAT